MDGLKHVAFIMDGNGRWATAKGRPRLSGHKAGAKAMQNLVPYAFSRGADVLSFYAFSTENWSRPKREVEGILSLLMIMLENNLQYLIDKKIRLSVTGDISVLSETRRKKILKAVEETANFKKTVNILFNYGGKADILHAVKSLVLKGVTNPTEDDFEKELYSSDLPPVDMVIRTSGEKRLSNLLPWQTAYSELYFTDIFWPDFDNNAYDEALNWFFERKRRFGGLDEKR